MVLFIRVRNKWEINAWPNHFHNGCFNNESVNFGKIFKTHKRSLNMYGVIIYYMWTIRVLYCKCWIQNVNQVVKNMFDVIS